jgi:peroxiredoxin
MGCGMTRSARSVGKIRPGRWACFMAATVAIHLAAAHGAYAETASRLLETTGKVKTGQAAPLFSGLDLDGHRVSLESLRGHSVIVGFGATYCGVCEDVLGELVRVRDAYRDSGLTVIMVSIDDMTLSAATLKTFFKQAQRKYPVIHDKDTRIAKSYGVTMIPIQFLIDPTGVIRKIHLGYRVGLEQVLGLPPISPVQ